MWLGREVARLLTGRVTTQPVGGAQVRELLATRGPERMLLVVDDVHLVDAAGADVLTALLATPGDRRPHLVLTATTGSVERLPAGLTSVLAGLPRHALSPLDLAGVVKRATEVLGLPPAGPFAVDLLATAGGNPAALHGVLTDALAARAVVVIDEQAWCSPRHRLGLPADHPLPHRLAELPGGAARVAEVLAVAGLRPVAELAAECGLPVAEVRRAVAALVTAGVFADDSSVAIPVLAVSGAGQGRGRGRPQRRVRGRLRVVRAAHR